MFVVVVKMVPILLVMVLQVTWTSSYDGNERLLVEYYRETCPTAEDIVRHNVEVAVLQNPRMAAALLRLHFHDCFVMGCDASVLLDGNGEMKSEKEAGPNLNSLNGFELIDKIKYQLERACPLTVSCADILATAARDAVALRGGPRWEVELGRKDSTTASFDGANEYIPAPNASLEILISNFKQQGLDIGDLVALSGSHTIGEARCLSFKQRIYNPSSRKLYHDKWRNLKTFGTILQSICPESGKDDESIPLDYETPARFDNHYFLNIVQGRGLLASDNVLVAEDYQGHIRRQVWEYALNQQLFFASYVNSIIKMGRINVLVGDDGEIRDNCRFVNTE